MPLPPKEEARFVFTVFASVAKQSPGRVVKNVILSMPSEQTCLQGIANEDIHKALAFLIKMLKTIVLTRQR